MVQRYKGMYGYIPVCRKTWNYWWKKNLQLSKNIPHRTEWIIMDWISRHRTTQQEPWYLEKIRTNTLIHSSCNSWHFDQPNHSISQNIYKKHIPLPACFPTIIWRENWFCAILYVLPKLGTQCSEEYFRQAKELTLRRPLKILEGAEKGEEWAKFRDVMRNIDECMAKTVAKGWEVRSLELISSFQLFWNTLRILGEEWKEVASWNEGRWKNLLHALGDQAIN